jgi:hypothetical protein
MIGSLGSHGYQFLAPLYKLDGYDPGQISSYKLESLLYILSCCNSAKKTVQDPVHLKVPNPKRSSETWPALELQSLRR